MRTINFVGDSWFLRTDEEEPEEDILRIAAALGRMAQEMQPGSTIYVGYDTRAISQGVAHEVAEIIAAYGITAKISDTYCPVAALCRATRLDPESFAGIMLTAGNRPYDYIGVRLWAGDGSAVGSNETDVLEDYIVPELPSVRGEAQEVDVITSYLESIGTYYASDAIVQKEPLVVCDVMYGPMTSHAARLLGSLGARVCEIHGEPDRDAKNFHPEAAEPWIDECEEAVLDTGAAFGIAIDGAGERIALVDEKGRHVTPHMMLAIVMEYLVKRRGITGRMVAPIFLSSIIKRQAERLGLGLTITPAGYVWLREEMLAGDVVCAGDALGGVGIPAVMLERDGLSVSAALVDAIMQDGRPLSEIVDDLDAKIGHMEYGSRSARMGSADIQALRNLLPGMNPAEVAGKVPAAVSHSAGSLRLDFEDDSWVLLRPSRNSNAARVYAEASTPQQRDALLDAGVALALEPFSATTN